MSVYPVFTVVDGSVSNGAAVRKFQLKGAGVEIPALVVGEEGRGRELGVLPVANPPMKPCSYRGHESGMVLSIPTVGRWDDPILKCGACGVVMPRTGRPHYDEAHRRPVHPHEGEVPAEVLFAEVGQTKAGKPKLFAKQLANDNEFCIVVFRTQIGFRGGNEHTGDRAGWKCQGWGCRETGEGPAPETCPKCGAAGINRPSLTFSPFPGEVIVRGRVAQGDAGRMGGGEQLVALLPKDVVFRTGYSGRLYGSPSAHYYMWDGEKILSMTWDERVVADLF